MAPDDASYSVSRRTVLRTGTVGAGLALGVGTASASGRGRRQRLFTSIQKPEHAVAPQEPVDPAQARGFAVFKANHDEEILYWVASLRNVDAVTGVHVHRGGPDENGPHLVELYNTEEPTGAVDGYLDSGAVGAGDACTEADFPVPTDCVTQPGQPSGPPEDVSFAEVLAEIRAGDTYVQVHTTDGVARGQIR